MAFTAKDVMALREKTGAGVMDCKKALTDTDGDMEKATDLLRERGIAKAEKKASRIAAEGIVACYIEGSTGVLLEVNCESDFVAKNPRLFSLFIRGICLLSASGCGIMDTTMCSHIVTV